MSPDDLPSARAVRLPEIVACIAQQLLEPDWDRQEVDGTCFAHYINCMVLNKLWFQETARALWYCPRDDYRWDDFSKHLPTILARSTRPQFYADLIYEASMDSDLSEDDEEVLRGLHFPKLKVLSLTLSEHLLPHFSVMKGVHLEILRVDPPTGTYPVSYWTDEDGFERLLDEIAEIFPGLQQLEFVDTFIAHQGWEARLRQRLPALRWSGPVIDNNAGKYPSTF